MDNTEVFDTFMVKIVDGKNKAEWQELQRGELLRLAASTLINKVEIIRPDRQRLTFSRGQHPLDAIANAPAGSVITIKKELR